MKHRVLIIGLFAIISVFGIFGYLAASGIIKVTSSQNQPQGEDELYGIKDALKNYSERGSIDYFDWSVWKKQHDNLYYIEMKDWNEFFESARQNKGYIWNFYLDENNKMAWYLPLTRTGVVIYLHYTGIIRS